MNPLDHQDLPCSVLGCVKPATKVVPLSLIKPGEVDTATVLPVCGEHFDARASGADLEYDETRFFNA
jgi:hypothetical protein